MPQNNESHKIEEIVNQQLDAYNAHDIDAFVKTYHDDVELFMFPNECFCQGKAQLYELYKKRFTDRPEAIATIASRIVMGNFVSDDETVTGIPDVGHIRLLATYEIKDNLITKVWFIYEKQN